MPTTNRSYGPYRVLLGRPEGRRLAVAAAGARLPQGMMGISMLFLLLDQRGPRTAGFAAACYTLGVGAAAPLTGRLTDRLGIRPVVVVATLVHSALVAILVVTATLGGNTAVCLVGAALVGLALPPLGPAVRALWLRTPAVELRRVGAVVDAAMLDASLVVGPVAASALVAVRPYLGLLTAVGVTWVGAWFLISGHGRLRLVDEPAEDGGHRHVLGCLRLRAVRRVLVVMVLASSAIASVAVGLPVLARLRGDGWAAGPLVGAFSVGSIIGALSWGRRRSNPSPPVRLAPALLGLALTLATLPVVGPHPVALLVTAPLAGLPVAVVLATLAMTAAAVAPPGSATEIQSWLVSANTVGSAVAALLATGLLARGEILLALGAPVLLAVLAVMIAEAVDRSGLG
jgi:MFS family permease